MLLVLVLVLLVVGSKWLTFGDDTVPRSALSSPKRKVVSGGIRKTKQNLENNEIIIQIEDTTVRKNNPPQKSARNLEGVNE